MPLVGPLFKRIEDLEAELDITRSHLELGVERLDQFERDRRSDAYQSVFTEPEPLVSVCIATYNRARLVCERALESIREQDYQRLEVVVVGDGCTDDTADRIRSLKDARIRFVNLPQRGVYPEKPEWRWMVAGTPAFNHALREAKGHLITHLDDDDRYAADRISTLVRFIQSERADVVWHPYRKERPSGTWMVKQAAHFRKYEITTSVVLYHHWFRSLPWDERAYTLREPGDWNRFRKYAYLGARCSRYPRPLLWHYRERNQ